MSMRLALNNTVLRTASRRFVSSSSKRLGGDGHGHGEHHEVHKVFTEPYNTKFIAAGFITVISLGVLIPTLSVGFQNRKHGFTK